MHKIISSKFFLFCIMYLGIRTVPICRLLIEMYFRYEQIKLIEKSYPSKTHKRAKYHER